jgi:ribosomal protein L35AE/L33A
MYRAPTAVLVSSLLIAPAFGSGGRFGDSVGQAGQLRVQHIDGGAVDPFAAPAGTTAIVFIFTSTDCPISNRYAPEVRRIAETFGSKGVVFRLVYPNPAEEAAAIREHMSAFSYAGATAALRDPAHALVKFAGATVTPEAAVYAGGRIVYRGRIDNRHVDLGVERPAATKRDLADALTAVLAGKPVLEPTTKAVGCFIADFVR